MTNMLQLALEVLRSRAIAIPVQYNYITIKTELNGRRDLGTGSASEMRLLGTGSASEVRLLECDCPHTRQLPRHRLHAAHGRLGFPKVSHLRSGVWRTI